MYPSHKIPEGLTELETQKEIAVLSGEWPAFESPI